MEREGKLGSAEGLMAECVAGSQAVLGLDHEGTREAEAELVRIRAAVKDQDT